MKRVIIIGASSGLGKELALHHIKAGNIVGIAGRRENLLEEIKAVNPNNVFIKKMDTTKPQAKDELMSLIEEMGGMDVFVYSSGTGFVNREMDIQKEMQTVEVNVYGFTQLVNIAYHYFAEKGSGHIVGIASVAGERTMSRCPAYNASKRYNMMYLKAIRQLAEKKNYNIKVTIIMPGFVHTELLKTKYPLTTNLDKAGRLLYNAVEKGKKKTFIPGYWGLISSFMYVIPPFIWKKII